MSLLLNRRNLILLSIGTFVLLAFAIGGILFADTAGSKLVQLDGNPASLNSAINTKESAKLASSSSVDNGMEAKSASTKQPGLKAFTANRRIIVIAVVVSVLVLLAVAGGLVYLFFFHRAPQPVPDPEPVPVTIPEPVPEPKTETEEPKILGLWPRVGIIVVSVTLGFIACELFLPKFKQAQVVDDGVAFGVLFAVVFVPTSFVLLALVNAIFVK